MINHTTIRLTENCSTLDWVGERLIDWTSNRIYYDPLNQGKSFNKYSFGKRFDAVKSINKGEYVVIYERLGTKGLILKNGELIREIDRSYYYSDVYEYPIELFKYSNSVLIAHCPSDYNQLEIEEIETGKRLTESELREPKDIFHSRLEVSPNGKFLLSAGWVWHPVDVLTLFETEEVLANPKLLDTFDRGPCISSEVSSATFMDDSRILVLSSDEDPLDEDEFTLPPSHVGIYNIEQNRFETMWKQPERLGKLIPINNGFAWDLFEHPKILNLKTGQVIASIPNINSGKQNSSIIHHLDLPYHSISSDRTKLAISNGDKIELLQWVKDDQKPAS